MKPPLVISGLVFPLTLLVVGVGYGATYGADRFFPESLVDDTACYGRDRQEGRLPTDGAVSSWISHGGVVNHLRGLRERPLGANSDVRTLRFFDYLEHGLPMMVRIDSHRNGDAWLNARHLGRCDHGSCVVTRRITIEERDRIERLQAAAFAQVSDDCSLGLDGDHWLLEAAGGGQHRLMRRWDPHKGPVYDLGAEMLALTGWSFEYEPRPRSVWAPGKPDALT